MLGEVMEVADSLLGGDDGGAAKTKAETPPEFVRRDRLNADGDSGASGEEIVNTFDQKTVHLVHFGNVHADDGAKFDHGELDDTLGEVDLDGDQDLRALQFRSALTRETLLLHGFMGATQKILKDYKDSQGPLGEIAGAAMDMLSGDEPEDQPPDPAELDIHKTDVSTAGGLANQKEIPWLDLHTAGRDLHLHRADFQQFCANAESYYVKKDGGGGGGGFGGLMPEIPGVPDGIKTVQGIVFKAFDIYLAMYLLCRAKYEKVIEDATYELGIDSIREQYRPVFDIWFPQPPPLPPEPVDPTEKPPEKNKNVVEEAVEQVNEQIDKVEKEIEKVENKIDEVRDDVRDFLGFEDDPPECHGTDALAKIFGALRGPQSEDNPGPEVGRLYLDAFDEVLGLDIPGFVRDIIQELTTINLDLIERVYTALMMGRARVKVDEATMIRAGREALADGIIALAAKFIPGLGMLDDPDHSFMKMQGVGDFGGEEIGNLGSKYLDQGLGKHLGKLIELSSAQLAVEIEAARLAAGDTSITMETLLAELPRVLTLQFRNTFFPLVDLLLETVFGAIAGPLDSAMSPVKGFIGDVKSTAQGAYNDVMGVYEDAMEVKDKIGKVQDKLASGVSAEEIAKDPEGFVEDLWADDPTGGPGEEEEPKPPFPGSPREHLGTGKSVTKSDADEVDTQQQEMRIVNP